jgi:hypothetical protein
MRSKAGCGIEIFPAMFRIEQRIGVLPVSGSPQIHCPKNLASGQSLILNTSENSLEVNMDRTELEERAKACCPAELWYELLDTIDETPDTDLLALIEEYE